MNIKHYAGIAAGLILVIFILQNMTVVDVRFLFWHLSVSRAIMIFILLAIGIVIGWLLHSYYLTHKAARRKA